MNPQRPLSRAEKLAAEIAADPRERALLASIPREAPLTGVALTSPQKDVLPESSFQIAPARRWSSAAERARQSERLKIVYTDPEQRERLAKQRLLRPMLSLEARELMSEKARARWASMTPQERRTFLFHRRAKARATRQKKALAKEGQS